MQDEYLATPRVTARQPRTGRTILIVAFLAFVMGAVLVGWLASRGRLDFAFPQGEKVAKPALVLVTPSGSAAAPQGGTAAAVPPNAAASLEPVEARLESLEQRLARLDLRAEAASGNAARAEGLLVAFAVRRMIERGAPLGYLEDQLKLRFADAQPNAVQTIIDTARQPVTLDQLAGQLEALALALATAPPDESGWTKVRRELSGLFVIRSDSAHPSAAEDRIERARMLLLASRIDEAIVEVQRLPGATVAQGWTAAARRYAAAQRALDLIETAAMLEPSRLKDGSGDPVRQLSPMAAPAT